MFAPTRRSLAAALLLTAAAAVALADPVAPDSIGQTGPAIRLQVQGRTHAPVVVYFTHRGQRIVNANGAAPRYASRMSPQANFRIPSTLNGLAVTDTQVEIGVANDPLDPGILQATAFDSSNVMITMPLAQWMCENGYDAGNPVLTPNFLSTTSPVIYYSVSLAELGTSGGAFVSGNVPLSEFTIDASGRIAALPAYTFSLTPFMYVPGSGWVATSPPPTGMVVRYMDFTVAFAEDCAGPCYANCDASTASPVLNVADFTCFLQRYAAGESYANCDQSTIPPVLNVADFTCFLQQFAAGCP